MREDVTIGGMTVSIENTHLVAALEAVGVRYLRSSAPVRAGTLPPKTLIRALASHPESRFRETLISLFLRHPEYSVFVPELVASLETGPAIHLKHLYTAAVYLQRMWQTTLRLYLGDFPLLPDFFGKSEFGLPGPETYFGEPGLRALADQVRTKTGFAWWNVYQTAIHLLLSQLSLEKQHVVSH